MKLGVISDIHDNLVNLDKGLRIMQSESVDVLLCCGDVTTIETLSHLRANFSGEIFLVSGNMEIYSEAEARHIKGVNRLGRFGTFTFSGQLIGACHEPFNIEKIITSNPAVEIIFYGHTHKPWMEERMAGERKINIVNPGTLGGVFQRATLAVYNSDSREVELKILDTIDL